jgi:lipopolysaccharide/colanic/teichoic acid biosynthesis glycosyltransferase/glycosyltransferase involved in cell wall biosynthesis
MIAKRIVVIAGYAPSLINFRGPLLRSLRDEGHQVIALAPGNDVKVEEKLASWGVHYRPIRLQRTGMNAYQDFRDMVALAMLLKELRPDSVLAYTIKPVTYGLIAARIAGVSQRYALITGLGYSFQGLGFRRRALSLLTGSLYRLALLGGDCVIFQNADDRDLFIHRRLVRSEQTAVVNGSGVDLNHYRPSPLPEAPVFLLIARLLYEKGIKEYVQAARELHRRHPTTRFLLAGPLDSNPSAISSEVLQEWIGEGIIEYVGTIQDVRTVLTQCSIYVLPSYREGTPRTVLEAMASGRPVVTTDAPGCRDTVVDGENGFLIPVASIAPLAAAMTRLIEDAPLRARMGQASLEIARAKYDVRLVNRQMLEAMRLVTTPGRPTLRPPLPSRAPARFQSIAANLLKRAIDFIVSLFMLSILMGPMLGLAALIRLKIGNPVLFKQQRPGRDGKPFTMYKFRTMTDERGLDGQLLPDDIRLTSFGKFLRATSLDELPGLINVLRGDMSLVGPRPLLMAYLPLYTETQARRHEVRPGVTGWAQVNGRNALSWAEKFEHDVWYVDHRSLVLDLRILLMTVQKVFKREGISAQGEATMPRFEGSQE